jgi:membrane-bound metal-dependent hydrolase YbcI (DUF457 family)
MPSPIAHLAVGYAVYRQYRRGLPRGQRRIWKFSLQLIAAASLSLLPDLDVVPAIIFRDMGRFHNNSSHSLLVAIPVALLVASIFHQIYRSGFWRWFWICLLSYDLHVLMDALTAERGVMMFWPLTPTRFASPIKLFYGLQWGLGWISIYHLWTILTESAFALIVIRTIDFLDRKKDQQTTILSPTDR